MTSDLVDQLAHRVTTAAGARLDPPADLMRIARFLGVDSIHEASMVEDGRLEQVGGSSRIYVRSGTVPSRRRFTIAHELGHIVLAGREAELIAHRSAATADPEERFCNQFAAALLLPRSWLDANVPRQMEALSIARNISRLSQASLAATVVRLREVLRWRSSLLQWRCVDGAWRLSTTVGLPLQMHNRITSLPGTRIGLGAAPRNQDCFATLPLAIAGEPMIVRGELCVRRTSAVFLVRLQ